MVEIMHFKCPFSGSSCCKERTVYVWCVNYACFPNPVTNLLVAITVHCFFDAIVTACRKPLPCGIPSTITRTMHPSLHATDSGVMKNSLRTFSFC